MYIYLRSGNSFQRFLGAHLLHGAVVFLLVFCHEHFERATGFLLLLVEIVNDDSNKEIEREEGAEDNKEDKVEVHVDIDFSLRLLVHLRI